MSDVALLDVNVLIALFDNEHKYHDLVSDWLIDYIDLGNHWASCPNTQNGCLRIISLPKYPNRFDIGVIQSQLTKATQHRNHIFLPDDISLTQANLIDWQKVQGHNQLTDIYLIALTQKHHAKFVTLDSKIDLATLPSLNEKDVIFLLS